MFSAFTSSSCTTQTLIVQDFSQRRKNTQETTRLKMVKTFTEKLFIKRRRIPGIRGQAGLSGALSYRYDKCISVPVFSPDGVSAVTLCDEFYQAEHRAMSEKRQAERFRWIWRLWFRKRVPFRLKRGGRFRRLWQSGCRAACVEAGPRGQHQGSVHDCGIRRRGQGDDAGGGACDAPDSCRDTLRQTVPPAGQGRKEQNQSFKARRSVSRDAD